MSGNRGVKPPPGGGTGGGAPVSGSAANGRGRRKERLPPCPPEPSSGQCPAGGRKAAEVPLVAAAGEGEPAAIEAQRRADLVGVSGE